MASAIAKVTPQGVIVPHSLIASWEGVEEVEIEQRPDAIIIKPRHSSARPHAQLIDAMKRAGLVENLPWVQPPVVSSAERARLAEKLSQGEPLSEIIVEDREERA